VEFNGKCFLGETPKDGNSLEVRRKKRTSPAEAEKVEQENSRLVN
jgi:hypothetical protein